nr:DNA-directed DNA polymerase [Tanacetum cinerariifolium]
MAPPGFAPVQNSQNRYNLGQGNNFNRGNNFHGNQHFQVLNQGFQNQPFQVPNNQVQQGVPNEFLSYKKANDQMMRNMQNQINSLKGEFKNEIQNTMNTQQTVLMNQQNAFQNNLQNMLSGFFQNQASTSGTLPSNTIPNPKGEKKAITTRSVVAYEGPSIPTNTSPKKVVEREIEETTDKEQTNFQGSIAHIQPSVTLILEHDVPKTLPKPNIPYPSILNDQKLGKKATNQMEKFFQIFQDLHFDISFANALLLMPKFAFTIKRMDVCHALAVLDASINLMPLSIWKKLSLPELTPTRMTLELADRSITRSKGVSEAVFIKVGKFHFLTDFVVVDFEADPRVPLILGRSFLRTGRTLIDVYGEKITLRVNDDAVTFNLNQTTRNSSTYDDLSVNRIDIIDVAREEYAQEILGFSKNSLGDNPTMTSEPIIYDSSPSLTPFEGSDFILEEAVAWKITNIKGIDPRFYTHKILMEEDYKPVVQSQRWVNPKIHEVIRKEVIKLLDARMIYSISDSLWVSPIHCVSKKGGITVVENKKNELIPTRLVTGWRVCIDYRKLHDATRKYHFPLPFMDQMLERLVGNEFYCFLDGFSGYFQILINPPDQEKTTFTCPYGTFAYRRMPFSLCNALGTFQRYILVAVDYLLKWVEAKALPTNNARVVVKFLKFFFARFETPRAIISDRGTHFGNDKFAKVMSKYGVTHRLSTAYHPQTSGQVEVSNRGLKRILERTVRENRASWSEKLEDALWVLDLLIRHPFGALLISDHQKLQLNEINELHDQAYENSLIYKEKTKKLHDSKIKNRISNVGPFTITKVFPYGTVKLSQPDGLKFKVNGHRVKHYFGGDVPQLVVLDLQTFPMDK